MMKQTQTTNNLKKTAFAGANTSPSKNFLKRKQQLSGRVAAFFWNTRLHRQLSEKQAVFPFFDLLFSARTLCVLGLIVLLPACTATKYVPEGKQLYTGANIKFETNSGIPEKSRLTSELEEAIRPKPNASYLGMRPQLWIFYVMGKPKKKKGARAWIKRKLGQKPVYLSDASPERTAKNLKGVLQNNGYFEADVQYTVNQKEKTANITYTAKMITPPYRIREVYYERLDSVFGNMSAGLKKKSPLKPQQIYQLSNLEAELKRVAEIVRDSGYYFFNPNYLIFNADSSAGERQMDLHLGFDKLPDQARKPYRLDTITIVNQFQLGRDSASRRDYETLHLNGFQYRYRRNDFRPDVLINAINLRKDSLYRRIDHERTLSRLSDLGVFKFVNVRFTPEGDSLLQTRIMLTPLLKKSIRLEAQVNSKSNDFFGPAITASFINRNFLKGAELFQFQINGAYEVQINSVQSTPVNAFELGAEASLAVPRFISPIRIPYTSHRFMPQTTMRLGFRFQNRVGFFRLNSFNAAYGYIWRENERKTHTLYPIDLTYLQLGSISSVFARRLETDPFLQRSLRNQFIPGARYNFTYNSKTGEQETPKRNNIFFSGTVDIAGNLAYLTQRLIGSEGSPYDIPYQVAGQRYSQYTRADIDVRYYHDISEKHQLATRLIAGAGYAYGNAFTMPYVKQFSSGGPNSIRAFRARSVGPGSYDYRLVEQPDNFFIDQTGDAKLETNLEYRFGLVGFLKGALFVDAGNVWLLRNDVTRPGADFQWNRFASEIAVGSGFGLRIDVNFFVLRLDAAFPVRKPFLPAGNRWTLSEVNFLNRDWRRENLILNIAIGYPF